MLVGHSSCWTSEQEGRGGVKSAGMFCPNIYQPIVLRGCQGPDASIGAAGERKKERATTLAISGGRQKGAALEGPHAA